MADDEAGGIDKSGLDADAKKRALRAGLNAIGSSIPFVGGLISAGVGYWSEKEAEEVTNILKQWIQMLEDELREKGKTIAEIVARIDMQDERIRQRVDSPQYQLLMKKEFRNWSSIDTEYKRERVRNILANAAGTDLVSDDVIRLFLDWINLYSDFHFQVVGEIYHHEGITRGEIWDNLEKPRVREDSADADLFKMLNSRPQHRERDPATPPHRLCGQFPSQTSCRSRSERPSSTNCQVGVRRNRTI